MKIIIFGVPYYKTCSIMNQIIKELKAEYPSIDIKKIDIDDPKNYDIANQYKIKNIPLIIFEKDEKIIDKITGAISKTTFIKLIQKHYE